MNSRRGGLSIYLFAFLLLIGSTIPANGADEFEDAEVSEAEYFAIERVYDREIFSDPAQCEAARERSPAFNCKQWIRFYPNGEVALMLTDIPHRGSYYLEGETVYATVLRGDVETPMAFELKENRSILYNPFSNREWVIREEIENSWTYEDIITDDARQRLRDLGPSFKELGDLSWQQNRKIPTQSDYGRKWNW